MLWAEIDSWRNTGKMEAFLEGTITRSPWCSMRRSCTELDGDMIIELVYDSYDLNVQWKYREDFSLVSGR